MCYRKLNSGCYNHSQIQSLLLKPPVGELWPLLLPLFWELCHCSWQIGLLFLPVPHWIQTKKSLLLSEVWDSVCHLLCQLLGGSNFSFLSLQAEPESSGLGVPALKQRGSHLPTTELCLGWPHVPGPRTSCYSKGDVSSDSQSLLKHWFCLFLPTNFPPQAFKVWGSHWCTDVKIPAKESIRQV